LRKGAARQKRSIAVGAVQQDPQFLGGPGIFGTSRFGIYGFCWYYLVNDEMKDVASKKGDQNSLRSSTAM